MSYTLKIITDFAAAHYLRGYNGACANLHGHNWNVEVMVHADTLDEIGIAVDFKIVKKLTNEICDQLDHTCLNEQEPFTTINPTAEHIARYIYQALRDKLTPYPATVQAVSIWETERACATYQEP
jgi:6-pyruvoyltetrahydropterin/6-carboxytetrahydropterin synthase